MITDYKVGDIVRIKTDKTVIAHKVVGVFEDKILLSNNNEYFREELISQTTRSDYGVKKNIVQSKNNSKGYYNRYELKGWVD